MVTVHDSSSTFSLSTTSLVDTLDHQVVVGETATVQTTIRLVEGTTVAPVIQVNVTYTAGMLEIQRAYFTSPSNVNPVNCTISYVDRNSDSIIDALVARCDRIENSPDNIVNSYDQCNLVIEVLVPPSENNTQGRSLELSSTFSYTGGQNGTKTEAKQVVYLVIVEPRLGITYAIGPDAGDAGDVFQAQVNVTHIAGSNAPAYNINVTAMVCR